MGRYAIHELLGRGGMASVFRAVDPSTGQACALKRLTLPDEPERHAAVIELFHREYRTLRDLSHPSVVEVYDYGQDDESPYYTMELLDGDDLQARSPLPWQQACRVFRDVCSSLALLHARGLVHRDISPKNIRCRSDGGAKLLDFGAMSPMGYVKRVVGTPPLVPPEALYGQPIDGRADLFAVGGSLYYALSGRHAFPARTLAALRGAWRRMPRRLSQVVPDLPPELDLLVMSLLSLEPTARPRSANEVMERLSAIGGLPRVEQIDVSLAYLASPRLVGRDDTVDAVRTRLRRLHTHGGGTLWIEGSSGSGRSRMLETCVVEAKLSGALCARGGAADAVRPYGLLSALIAELDSAERPESQRTETARATLRACLPAAQATDADRAPLHAALVEWLLALSTATPTVLAIDDAERCDDVSLAALAAVAQAFRNGRVLVAVAASSDDARARPAALAVIETGAQVLRLSGLSRADTEALLASVFGQVAGLALTAGRIFERADGSPRATMELAQHLVDRGLVRYGLGSWVLPARLAADALPATLDEVRGAKIAKLDADARELAIALAVAADAGLGFDAYAELAGYDDVGRVGVAVDTLLGAQVLASDGLSYALAGNGWRMAIEAAARPAERAVAATRVAGALRKRERDPLLVARFEWEAGDQAGAIATLNAELARGSRWAAHPPGYAELLLAAANACTQLGRPHRDRLGLLEELVRAGKALTVPDVPRHAREVLAYHYREAGGLDWERGDPSAEPLARLSAAFAAAQQRYAQTPETERVREPLPAMLHLVEMIRETLIFIGGAHEVALLRELQPLVETFAALSPSLQRMRDLTMPGQLAFIMGRYDRALELTEDAVAFYSRPDVPGLTPQVQRDVVHALQYMMGAIQAGSGRSSALVIADELERDELWAPAGWMVRLGWALALGNVALAEQLRMRIELRSLERRQRPPLAAVGARALLFGYALSDDVRGLQNTLPALEELARLHASFRVDVIYVRASLARARRDYTAALEAADEALAQMEPGGHSLWNLALSCRIVALRELGRLQEAKAAAEQAIALARADENHRFARHLEVDLATVEARMGDAEGAARRIDATIAPMTEGAKGIIAALPHEARARIAIQLGDREAFEMHLARCKEQYALGEDNPALMAKFNRLLHEARHAGLFDGPDETQAETVATPPITRVRNVLSQCGLRKERYERALRLLLEESGAADAQLYVVGGLGLELVAASDGRSADENLESVLERLIGEYSQNEEVATEYMTVVIGATDATLSKHWTGSFRPERQTAYPLLLRCEGPEGATTAGAAVLYFPPESEVRLPIETAAAIARCLLDLGDAAPAATALTDARADREA